VDFDAAYARGRRTASDFFVVVARANTADGPRLGLAVATKAVGNSVQRNRIRRLIRESFRLRQRELPAWDLVVSARKRARGVASAELRASLDALWDKVKQQCASSRS
jgi:ribonuclease P protein component